MPLVKAKQKTPLVAGVYKDPASGVTITVDRPAQIAACIGNGWEFVGEAKEAKTNKTTAPDDSVEKAKAAAKKIIDDAKAEAKEIADLAIAEAKETTDAAAAKAKEANSSQGQGSGGNGHQNPRGSGSSNS